MQADIALFEGAERGIGGCRVYAWSEPWITLGKYQSADRDLVPGCAVPWIVRPTGGKAVLHGHDITVGFAMPMNELAQVAQTEGEVLERSLRTVYRLMTEPLISAMRSSGLPAALGEETRFVGSGPKVADCFAHVSPNDIVHKHTGHKVCGCALKLTRFAVLVQASIPTALPSIDPATVIVGGKLGDITRWRPEEFTDHLSVELHEMIKSLSGNL